MAVFKDENGVWKPGGYPYGRINPRIQQGRLAPDGGTSKYPQFNRICVHLTGGPGNAASVRAASIPLDGVIRKGGGCERKS